MFERAITLDPTFAQPHTWLAWLHQDDHDELFISPREEALANWLSEARRAISLDRNDAWAHVAFGLGLRRAGSLDEAIAALEEAIEINPSHSFAYATLGSALGAAGLVEQGISIIEQGIRLNPPRPNPVLHHAPRPRIPASEGTAPR
jgi:adenylate cyclase